VPACPAAPFVLDWIGGERPRTVEFEESPSWTSATGTIAASVDWGSDARVRVTGDLTIPAGVTLTIGAGSATVVSGLILLGLGQRDQKTVESAPPGSSYEEVREAAERGPKRTKAGVALMAVGGAAVVGGIIWQFKGGHEEAIPELSIGPTGVSIRGKF